MRPPPMIALWLAAVAGVIGGLVWQLLILSLGGTKRAFFGSWIAACTLALLMIAGIGRRFGGASLSFGAVSVLGPMIGIALGLGHAAVRSPAAHE